MDLQITVSSELPKWAGDPDGTMYDQALRAGALGAAQLVVCDSAPHVAGVGWGGDWSITPQVERTVYLERRFVVVASRKKKALWAISHLIKHELEEMKNALVLARKKYPVRSPYVMCMDPSTNIGGEAHALTCKTLDGLSEVAYMKQLTLESKYLGLGT